MRIGQSNWFDVVGSGRKILMDKKRVQYLLICKAMQPTSLNTV